MTLEEISARLLAEHDVTASTSTIDDWLKPNQLTYKKTAHASEQERSDVQAKRVAWRRRQTWLNARPELIGKVVFIDETGINTKMARLRGRCQRGRRLVASIPYGHWKTLTFIAGLRHDRLTAPWVIDGPMDGAPLFNTSKRSSPPRSMRVTLSCSTTCLLTKGRRLSMPSKSAAPGCCFCRHTRRTSIQLSWPFQNSKRTLKGSCQEP